MLFQRQDAFIVTSPQNVTPVQSQPLAASVQNVSDVFQGLNLGTCL